MRVLTCSLHTCAASCVNSDWVIRHSPWGGDGGAEETQYGARCIDNLVRAPDGTPLSPDILMFNWYALPSRPRTAFTQLGGVAPHFLFLIWSCPHMYIGFRTCYSIGFMSCELIVKCLSQFCMFFYFTTCSRGTTVTSKYPQCSF
jgi:hypothetical protein